MEKGKKYTISWHSRCLVPVPNSVVPVPYWFWTIGTGCSSLTTAVGEI